MDKAIKVLTNYEKFLKYLVLEPELFKVKTIEDSNVKEKKIKGAGINGFIYSQ